MSKKLKKKFKLAKKKRLLSKIDKKLSPIVLANGRIFYLIVKKTLNNFFLMFTTFKGKLLIKVSAGMSGERGTKRLSPLSGQAVGKILAEKVLKLPVYSIMQENKKYNIFNQNRKVRLAFLNSLRRYTQRDLINFAFPLKKKIYTSFVGKRGDAFLLLDWAARVRLVQKGYLWRKRRKKQKFSLRFFVFKRFTANFIYNLIKRRFYKIYIKKSNLKTKRRFFRYYSRAKFTPFVKYRLRTVKKYYEMFFLVCLFYSYPDINVRSALQTFWSLVPFTFLGFPLFRVPHNGVRGKKLRRV